MWYLKIQAQVICDRSVERILLQTPSHRHTVSVGGMFAFTYKVSASINVESIGIVDS